tara:strand:+ start:35076 stop:37376 length:2301 start_codon:yes stop_codon:yes gene_type:complete
MALFSVNSINAQVLVKVRLIDQESKEQIDFAELRIAKLQKPKLYTQNAYFEFRIKPGFFELQINSPGYEELNLPVKVRRDTSLLLQLTPVVYRIEEIEIRDNKLKSELQKSSLNIEQISLDENSRAEQNSLAEILEKKPGLQALNTGVGVSKPIIRGLMGSRISVINQGIRQEGQQWGMDHGLEIDPFTVERIEIIKGAASLQYGSSASAGIVKIMEDIIPKPGLGFQYNSRFKSNNQSLGNSIKLSLRKNKNFVLLRYSAEEFQDFKVPDSSFIYNGFLLPLVNGTLKNTAGKSNSLAFVYGHLGAKVQLRFHYSNYLQNIGLFPGATGIPRAYDLENLGQLKDIDIPNQRVNHQALKLNLNYKIKDSWLENNFGYQLNDRQENSNPLAHGFLQLPADNVMAIGLKLQTFSHNSLYTWSGDNWTTKIGMDQQFQKNDRDGWEFLIPNFESYELGVFGIFEKEESTKFNWNVGLRLQYAQIESQQHLQPYFANIDSLILRASALSKSFSNYSLSAGFSYIPNSRWSHKLNIAKSFRIPVAAELLSNGIHHGTFRHEMGDNELETENGIQFDWGTELQTQYLKLSISPFFNYFDNFIYLNPSASFSPLPDAGQIYTYSSTRAILSGAEISMGSNLKDVFFWNLGMEYVYNLNINTGLALPFSPPFSQISSLKYRIKKKPNFQWNIGLDQRLTAAQNRVDRNEKPTPGYKLFALNSNIEIKMKSLKINFGFSVQNIFNEAYLSHLSRYRILNLPEQGRNFIFQAKITF